MSNAAQNCAQSASASYIAEYMAAFDRAERLALKAPPRVLVAKDCVDPDRTLEVLLEYFARHTSEELVGQTVAINTALIPLLLEATGVALQLTIGWIELDGKPKFRHGEETLRRFMTEKLSAWRREGVPFHLWLTSPACEVLDVTFAMIWAGLAIGSNAPAWLFTSPRPTRKAIRSIIRCWSERTSSGKRDC
jgi:hypothetical protein